MCTVTTRTIAFTFSETWIANLTSELHRDRDHAIYNEFTLVAGGSFETLSRIGFERARETFASFQGEIVRTDVDECSVTDYVAPEGE